MKNFRTYQLAVEFYQLASKLTIKTHLRDQLLRSSSSIALNLAEGRGRATFKDQARFFKIAFGSARESQAILELANQKSTDCWQKLDSLVAHLYKLIQHSGG